MTRIDGRQLNVDVRETYDVVVVGSGPAGAIAAAVVAAAGARVAIAEEGVWSDAKDTPRDVGRAFAEYYRDNGTTACIGSPPTPYLQGRVVGGTSVVNGAISWRLPHDVFASWLSADPGLEQGITWSDITASTADVETRLNILPTAPDVAGPRNLLMAKGADAIGLDHRPINRNTVDCQGSGGCLSVCRNNAKQSMDITYVADAERDGADVYSATTVESVTTTAGRISGITALSRSGQRVQLAAKSAVVLAASAVQTPVLLLNSGIKHGPVGHHFQCHPGVSVSGRFSDPVHDWYGATQGHEVIGLRQEGLKFESIAMDISVLGMRMPGAGAEFIKNLSEARHEIDWGAAVKSSAKGRVRSWRGKPLVSWSPTRRDVLLFRRGTYVMGKMLLGAGAESVRLCTHGWEAPLTDPQRLEQFATSGPTKATAYHFALTHMFGTCRMGSDSTTNVVGPDFQHHRVPGLYIADSSVFPTNIGVNPQTSILALAQLCGRKIVDQQI